jgi:hypothetical protein
MYLSNHPAATLARVVAPGRTPGNRAVSVLNTVVVPHYTVGAFLLLFVAAAVVYLIVKGLFGRKVKAGRG